MNSSAWIWIILGIIVVIIIIAIIVTLVRKRSAQKEIEREQQRQQASELRDKGQQTEQSATHQEAEAKEAQAKAEQAKIEADQLDRHAAERTGQAENTRAKADQNYQQADALDPDVKGTKPSDLPPADASTETGARRTEQPDSKTSAADKVPGNSSDNNARAHTDRADRADRGVSPAAGAAGDPDDRGRDAHHSTGVKPTDSAKADDKPVAPAAAGAAGGVAGVAAAKGADGPADHGATQQSGPTQHDEHGTGEPRVSDSSTQPERGSHNPTGDSRTGEPAGARDSDQRSQDAGRGDHVQQHDGSGAPAAGATAAKGQEEGQQAPAGQQAPGTPNPQSESLAAESGARHAEVKEDPHDQRQADHRLEASGQQFGQGHQSPQPGQPGQPQPGQPAQQAPPAPPAQQAPPQGVPEQPPAQPRLDPYGRPLPDSWSPDPAEGQDPVDPRQPGRDDVDTENPERRG